MSKAIKKVVIALSFALVFSVFLQGDGHAQVAPKKRVLVLNSYHKGLSWTDNIVTGIESVFRNEAAGKDVELYFELAIPCSSHRVTFIEGRA